VISAPGATPIYTYNSDEAVTYGAGGVPTAAIRYEDTAGPYHGKLVYLAFGLEQIHRGYHTTTADGAHCMNHRSHLVHNALCWSRTGGFQGRVASISDGGQPINDPPRSCRRSRGPRWCTRCAARRTAPM